MTHKTLEMPPEIFVLGGPNGAGKTTTAQVLLPESLSVQHFVNADLIAKGLSPFNPEAIAIVSGRLMLERVHRLRKRRETFAFETTLASRSWVPFLRESREMGYLVHVIYIWLRSSELAIARVEERVKNGGHDIPPKTIRRRYARGLKNFLSLYQPIADTWIMCDNSGDSLCTVAYGKQAGATAIIDQGRFELIQKSIEHEN